MDKSFLLKPDPQSEMNKDISIDFTINMLF